MKVTENWAAEGNRENQSERVACAKAEIRTVELPIKISVKHSAKFFWS
jgi:hypothetical protein